MAKGKERGKQSTTTTTMTSTSQDTSHPRPRKRWEGEPRGARREPCGIKARQRRRMLWIEQSVRWSLPRHFFLLLVLLFYELCSVSLLCNLSLNHCNLSVFYPLQKQKSQQRQRAGRATSSVWLKKLLSLSRKVYEERKKYDSFQLRFRVNVYYSK